MISSMVEAGKPATPSERHKFAEMHSLAKGLHWDVGRKSVVLSLPGTPAGQVEHYLSKGGEGG